MEEENKVYLHGMWISTYVKRVELALTIKGIPFEYVEEDLSNKSPLLLDYNPVYKKVPVLVHNGKPVSESLIIIQYIDETWKNKPPLLPQHPYERASVRFWADFIHQLFGYMAKLFNSDGEDQEIACEEFYEKMRMLEDGILKNLFPGRNLNVQDRNLDLLDIMAVATLGAYKAQEEVFVVKILDPQRNPLIYSWVTSLLELPMLKEIVVPHQKIVSFLQMLKHSSFNTPNK